MDAPASLEPVAAATFLQRIGLNRIASRVKTSWKRSYSDRDPRFSYQVVVPSVTPAAEDHRTPTPEPMAQEPFRKKVEKKVEQDCTPPWASDNPEEPDKPAQSEEVEQAEEPKETEEPEKSEDPEDPRKAEYPTKVVLRSQAHAERLRKMTEQYNLPIPDELLAYATPPKEQSRVHRPVRMRVHRSCHRCNTMFGETRVCTGCQHRVCARCQPAQPQRHADSWRPISHDPIVADLEVDDFQGIQEQITMLRACRISTQPLVKKELRQRVRRRCHSCSTLFTSRNRTCTNCQHVCCVDCPRFPPKRSKYPDGYPGDEPSSSTTPIMYACHECHQTYPPVPHPDSPECRAPGNGPILLRCTQCGHTRCSSCQRAPPHMVARTPAPAPAPAPAPDPAPDSDFDVLQSVKARIAAI